MTYSRYVDEPAARRIAGGTLKQFIERQKEELALLKSSGESSEDAQEHTQIQVHQQQQQQQQQQQHGSYLDTSKKILHELGYLDESGALIGSRTLCVAIWEVRFFPDLCKHTRACVFSVLRIGL